MTATPLPPTTRDFEIHRFSLVELVSTRRIAEKFEISHTRVRQIIVRVSHWLAEKLPIPTEADQEREKRLAIHLAAAQLQHQVEHLQIFWNASSDPKYLRQQTRAILAISRLGVTPGSLDALAADAEDSAANVPPLTSDFRSPITDCSPPSKPETCNLEPETRPLPSAPPPGDCSPLSVPMASTVASSASAPAPSSSPSIDFGDYPSDSDADLAGLNLIEQRLLTLLEQTPEDDQGRHQSLTKTLSTIRQQRASCVVQLSPNVSGAIIHKDSQSTDHQPALTQPNA